MGEHDADRRDAVDAVKRLRVESPLPLRSHGSISMNKALLAAGLVDRLEVTVFPVITGESGSDPILSGLPDIDPFWVRWGYFRDRRAERAPAKPKRAQTLRASSWLAAVATTTVRPASAAPWA